ncbi:hypothetical protein COLO4_36480 [Corchorus olitorius]|uniref:Splicing factor Cactin C-terminal domain-containing protein n=1 Tax=Corchorus olitorius TaxID=93759 RepID=A0A1R3G8S5_9ROSI|nr:hypothetical protein COLO4_36480 [Corchorus olitorius]
MKMKAPPDPFGDSNLNQTLFVWRKKIERDVSQGVPLDAFSVKAEKKRQRERMAEIEKLKKRREEREIEKAKREESMALSEIIRLRQEEDDDDVELKAKKDSAMEEGDTDGVLEVNLESQQQDKNRLIKPKYLNRVHTGYEWNKYNRTHYDHENPPPKFVQGYKFNIFYPDLVDKGKAPKCSVVEEDGETCIIRFEAGAPYEDIAFRIVNKEWETSQKKGYKCTFEGGILRLYFNLKPFPYRR